MGDNKLLFWFNVVVGPLLGGFVAYWIAASVLREYSWCIVGEEHCVREWVSALSGWAAVAAALLSLPYLVGQWEEARKQTRFTIGDEEPTLDVIEHLEHDNRLVVRIVNWNRRAIFVWDVLLSTLISRQDQNEYTAVVRVEGKQGEMETTFPIQINGWEDRNAAPNFARIDLLLLRKAPGSEPNWESDEVCEIPEDAQVTAIVQRLGNVHKMYPISAKALPDTD